jgi:hypothetical protein
VSDYTKSTNFATKDALSSGNPLKIVKGTEIDTEFNNIQTAVATKADLASPTFTGTVVIPTATITTATITTATITNPNDGKGNLRTIVQNAQTTSYTLVAGDAGKHVSTTAAVIIPASVFATGEAITIYNNSSSAVTITCSAVTAYKAGINSVVTSASLVSRGLCTVLFYGSNTCVISGTV